MNEKPQLLDWLAEQAEHADLTGLGNKTVTWAFRAVHPDLRSREGFRYPWPGQWAKAPGPIQKHNQACPQGVGDGLCIAKTFRGAGMGGIPFSTFLLVGYTSHDVLGEDADKVRVRKMYVADVIALRTILSGAYLSGAYLYGANLSGANLYGANLYGANYSQLTLWPTGFDPKARGAVLR